MAHTVPAIRDLSKQILAQEADEGETVEVTVRAPFRAFEKLRLHLVRLVGVAGFQSLLARALVLAKPEAIWLQTFRVGADGALEELPETTPPRAQELDAEGCTALLAQFLGLLVTFIGESLTFRLVQEIWPTVRLNDMNSSSEEITT